MWRRRNDACGVAELLLRQGADVHAKDSTMGGTPLHWAAKEDACGVGGVVA